MPEDLSSKWSCLEAPGCYYLIFQDSVWYIHFSKLATSKLQKVTQSVISIQEPPKAALLSVEIPGALKLCQIFNLALLSFSEIE